MNKAFERAAIWISVSIVLNIFFPGSGAGMDGDHMPGKIPSDTIVSYSYGLNKVFEALPNDTDEVIMLGNSLTQFFEWHEIFRDVNIKNRGIGSDITLGVIQRLDEVIESSPLKIFIEIGINDIAKGYSIETIFGNYLKIIETVKLKSPATKIYIQSLLPCRQKHNIKILELNDLLKEYCTRNNITYIDLHSKFVTGEILNPKYDCGDNVHLNGEGYLLWCGLIRNYIYE